MIALVHFIANKLPVHSFQRAIFVIVALCTALFLNELPLITASRDMLNRMTREVILAHVLVNHRKLTVQWDEQRFAGFEQHFCSVTGGQISFCSTNILSSDVSLPQQHLLSRQVCPLKEDYEHEQIFVPTSFRFLSVQNLGNFHMLNDKNTRRDHRMSLECSGQELLQLGQQNHFDERRSEDATASKTSMGFDFNVISTFGENVKNMEGMMTTSYGIVLFAICCMMVRFMAEIFRLNLHVYEKIRSFLYYENTDERTFDHDSEFSEIVFSPKNIFLPTQCKRISVCLRQSVLRNRSSFIMIEIQPQQKIYDLIQGIQNTLDISESFLRKYCFLKINGRILQDWEEEKWEHQCFDSIEIGLRLNGGSGTGHDFESEIQESDKLGSRISDELDGERDSKKNRTDDGFGAAAIQQSPPMTFETMRELLKNNPEMMAALVSEFSDAIPKRRSLAGAASAAAARYASSESMDEDDNGDDQTDIIQQFTTQEVAAAVESLRGKMHTRIEHNGEVETLRKKLLPYWEEIPAVKAQSLRNNDIDVHKLELARAWYGFIHPPYINLLNAAGISSEDKYLDLTFRYVAIDNRRNYDAYKAKRMVLLVHAMQRAFAVHGKAVQLPRKAYCKIANINHFLNLT